MAVGMSAHILGFDETLLDSLSSSRTTTIIVGAPATYHELIAQSRPQALSPPLPRACIFGGAPASASLNAQVEELFGVPLLTNYGCTETCGAFAIDKPGDVYRDRSCGTPLPGMEVRLMSPDGNEVDEGEDGEIWVRSPSLMLKYHKDDGTPFTAGGWYRTGDLGRRVPGAGHLKMVGRLKEVILRGGENISPDEVERILQTCPGVVDVAVTGIPHSMLGETPAAFIVRNQAKGHDFRDHDLDLKALLAACRASLPDHKVPTAFYEIDAIPRTLLGEPISILLLDPEGYRWQWHHLTFSVGKTKRLKLRSCTSRPLTARSQLLSSGSIEALVLAETAGACGLKVDPDESDSGWLGGHLTQPFAILGLSSLAGVILRDRLASLTGLTLPTTLVYVLLENTPLPGYISVSRSYQKSTERDTLGSHLKLTVFEVTRFY